MAGARHKFNELEVEMIDINELRRLAQAATPGPWKLLPVGDKSKCFAVADINFLSVLTVVDECGTSFGAVYLDGDAKFIAAANPAAVSELLDRLEAAEAEALEEARLNGMGSEREAKHLAQIAALEKERDAMRAELDALRKEADKFSDGVDWIQRAMQAEAELDALKRQEPVAWLIDWADEPDLGHYFSESAVDEDSGRSRPLFLHPVPAQSVPDGFREGAEAAARLIDQKAELYATRLGYNDMGGLSFGQGPHAESKMDHYAGLLELADELRAALAAAPKPEVK